MDDMELGVLFMYVGGITLGASIGSTIGNLFDTDTSKNFYAGYILGGMSGLLFIDGYIF